MKAKLYKYKEQYYTVSELSKKYGCSYKTMLNRIKNNGNMLTPRIMTSDFVKRCPTLLTFKYKDKIFTIKDLADIVNITKSAMYCRLKRNNWKVDKTILQDRQKIFKYAIGFDGEKISLVDLAKKHNLPYKLLKDRYDNGKQYRDEYSLSQPPFSL